MAKVLTVDGEKMELQVMSQPFSKSSSTAFHEEEIIVKLAQKNDLPQDKVKSYFPACVVPDAIIRFWGQSASNEKNVFIATDIRGCRQGHCSDATGVRFRLLRFLGSGDGRGPGGHGNGLGNGHGGGGNGGGGRGR